MDHDTEAAPKHRSDDLVVRSASFRSLNEEARTCDFICSTDAVDSYGEIVEQDWNLARYLTNPVILFGHRSRELPIGTAKNVGVIDGKLQCTVVFASKEANPLAEQVFRSVCEGTLRAVSVGFMPGDYRYEKRNGEEVLVLSNNELHEISVVPLPANPEALAKMRAKAREAAASSGRKDDDMDKDLEIKNLRDSLAAEKESAKNAVDHLNAAHEKALADAGEKLGQVESKASTLEAEAVKLAADRDASEARAAAAEEKLLELEILSLVGDKIDPEEKADLLKVAKSDRATFDRMMARRAPKKMTERAIPDAPTQAPSSAAPAGPAEDPIAKRLEAKRTAALGAR